MRLLLDEHISYRIAERLRARGHDAVALTEIHELRGLPDRAIFAWAVAEDRAIVTYDTGFASVLQERIGAELALTDVIVVPERRFAGGDRGHGALLRALIALVDTTAADAARGRLIWLTEAGT